MTVSSIGETEKRHKGPRPASRMGCGMTFVLFLLKKFPGEEASVRECVIMMQQPHIYMQLPQNVTVVCGIDCLACWDNFIMFL
jgi:hypothetical protein